jgi:hypothetical protein
MAADETTRRVRDELALLRASDNQLLAASRATVAAARDGWTDPVTILAGLLEERGQTPGPDQHPAELLAQASLPHKDDSAEASAETFDHLDDLVLYLDPARPQMGPESPTRRAEGPASA